MLERVSPNILEKKNSLQNLTKVFYPHNLKEYSVGKWSYIWWNMMVKSKNLLYQVTAHNASSPVGY